MTVRAEPRGRGPRGAPKTRPHGIPTLLLCLLLALASGLGAALAPVDVWWVGVGALGVALLLVRLEWAVAVYVAASVLTGCLELSSDRTMTLLTAALTGAWVIRRSRWLLWSPPCRLLGTAAALAAVVVASALVNAAPLAGLSEVLSWLAVLGVLAVLVDAMRHFVDPLWVARAYVVAAAAAALIGLAVWSAEGGGRIAGTVSDPEEFAFFMLVAVPLSHCLRGRSRRVWLWDVVTCVLVVAAFGTLSRGATVALVAMLGFAAACRLIRLRVAGAFVVLFGTALAFFAAVFPTALSRSVADPESLGVLGLTQHVERWQAAWAMTLDRLLLGHGPGSFAHLVQDYADLGSGPLGSGPVRDPHSTYLMVSAELGLVGLGCLLALLAFAGASAWQRWRLDHDPLSGAVSVALVGAVIAAAFVTVDAALPLWLVVALAGARAGTRRTPPATATLVRLQRDPRSEVSVGGDTGDGV